MNRMYVAELNEQWLLNPAQASAAGMPSATGPDLVTGGIEGAFWPVRQKIAQGSLSVVYDGEDWFVVPITLAWLTEFVEEISPDRDTEYDNWAVLDVRIFLNGAVENGRWALVGMWR